MTASFLWLTVLVFVYTATAMLSDVRSRNIPNWLTVGSLVAAIIFHVATDGTTGLQHALGGFAAGFGFLLVLWLIGGAGGGDVKLTGALGAWLGPSTVLLVLLVSTPLAVVCVLAANVYRRGRQRGQSAGSKLPLLKRGVPYAIPVGLASWSILLLKLIAPQS